MAEKLVPIQIPENFGEMLQDMASSDEPCIGWCLLCNSPIRSEADMIPQTNTHKCKAG